MAQIWDKCRKEITMLNYAQPISDENVDSSVSETFSDKDLDFTTNSVAVQTLNTSLQELGESPIDKRKVKSKHYATSKVKKISSSMKGKFFVAAENSSEKIMKLMNQFSKISRVTF
ncbi:hypothetical protein AVEN_256465-1 [Araneus ventricosus]|uniref:Uncharacterized protein n=1 Tax=Araneus ventricosus TaxID=182803 RepID=A0A4Y2H0J9_ARAVE|nr:hypothetical protein AVEN_256465-1 [Araneus ventricosus]